MLNDLQRDIRELINLVRETAHYDATLATARLTEKPIVPGRGAAEDHLRKGERIQQLRAKWDI